MYTLAAAIVLCLAIAGQVQACCEDEEIQAEIQTLETALGMTMIQDETAQTQEPEVCSGVVTKWTDIQVLTDTKIKDITNYFTGIDEQNKKTYLYVPYEQTKLGGFIFEVLFSSSGNQPGLNHAEDNMYFQLKPNIPQEFWLTKSPCPICARNLIKRYKGEKDKPHIHLAHFYAIPPRGESQKEKSIQCLALMMKKGFTFEVWDWTKFSEDFLKIKVCKDELKKYTDDKVYKTKLAAEKAALSAALTKAKGYKDTKKEKELCQP